MAGEDATVTECTRCADLVASRSRIVNGVGPADAELLLVGEAPGAREDERGEPFVGRSGSILDEALDDAGLDRGAVRITNCVRCRPPDNRDPRIGELENCTEWLDAEIAAVDPTVILAVGKVPASHLLDRDVAVTSAAGSVGTRRVGTRSYPVVICVHPAAVLYDRSQTEQLDRAIGVAAERLGVRPEADAQSNLEEF